MSSGRRIVEIPVEKKIERILKSKKLTVTTAESCTGGLIAGTLVNAPGISEVYKEGYITYSNDKGPAFPDFVKQQGQPGGKGTACTYIPPLRRTDFSADENGR